MLSPPQPASAGFSHVSATSHSRGAFEIIGDDAVAHNPWVSSPSGYSSLHESEVDDPAMYFFQPHAASARGRDMHSTDGNGYEGLEGIYRFIEECDRARS